MKFLRIDLLTLLISLFILSSCRNQDGIGLTPNQTLSGTLVVDSNIVVNTMREDSAFTNALAKTPLGYFNDPQIGVTESDLAMVLSLPSSSPYAIPDGTITIDSAVLVLRFADGFYGDSLNSKYKLNVYQLREKPASTVNYYNTRGWDPATVNSFNPTGLPPVLVGSKTFASRTHTGFKIMDIVPGAVDTFKTVQPQVRIPIDRNFINTNLFAAPATVLASNTLFQNQVKGFYLSMDKNQPGAGGSFMVAADSSSVDIYYRADNGTTIDTAIVSLPVANHAAQIKHTYTASVQAVLNNQATSNSTFYLQGLLGLKAKISFPNLQDIVTKAGGNIVINRAELVVTPTNGSIIPFLPQSRLTLYQYDNAFTRISIEDAGATGTSAFSQGLSVFGGYLTTNYDYHFVVTGHLQNLLLGKDIDYGMYLGVIDNTNTTGIDIAATPQAAGRVVAAGTVTDKTSPDFPYKIKLNIIYTKVNSTTSTK